MLHEFGSPRNRMTPGSSASSGGGRCGCAFALRVPGAPTETTVGTTWTIRCIPSTTADISICADHLREILTVPPLFPPPRSCFTHPLDSAQPSNYPRNSTRTFSSSSGGGFHHPRKYWPDSSEKKSLRHAFLEFEY